MSGRRKITIGMDDDEDDKPIKPVFQKKMSISGMGGHDEDHPDEEIQKKWDEEKKRKELHRLKIKEMKRKRLEEKEKKVEKKAPTSKKVIKKMSIGGMGGHDEDHPDEEVQKKWDEEKKRKELHRQKIRDMKRKRLGGKEEPKKAPTFQKNIIKGRRKFVMNVNPDKRSSLGIKKKKKKQRFVSDKKVCHGRFRQPYESGGYRSYLNPQVEFFISENATVKMELETRFSNLEPAVVFFVTKPTRESGRCTSLRDDDLFHRSEFVRGQNVDAETTCSPGRYIATVCMEDADLEGDFTFTVTCVQCEKIRVLPDFDRRYIRGNWRALNGGYQSTKNPQFALHLKRKTRIVLRLEDKSEENAVFMFITKMVHRGRKRVVVEEDEIIKKSSFVRTGSLLLELDLEPSSLLPYIIIPCSSKEPLDFTLVVESDVRGAIGKIEEIVVGRKLTKESGCEDILDKHRDFENPPYMVTNPIDDIIKFCQENNCNFIDEEFPPTEKSLNRPDGRSDIPVLKGVAAWKRGREFLESPDLYCDGIEIQDMRQGNVGDCWLCQGIATACLKEDRISSLISPPGYSKYGVYTLKMYHEDAWKYMVIDDYFPIDKDGKFVFARSQDPNEMFVPLMEKAFAKEFRSYRALARRSIGVAMEFLTGGQSSVMIHAKSDMQKLWEKMKRYDEMNWLMGASSKDNDEESQGIKGKHAYSIMSVHDIDNRTQLLKIRNTWGNFEWEGAWGDNDEERWTPELKKRLNFQNLDDGIFHMSLRDYFLNFEATSFCWLVKDIYPHAYSFRGDWSGLWCHPERLRGDECKKLPLTVLEDGTNLHLTLVRTSNDIDVEDNAIMLVMVKGAVSTNMITSRMIFAESRFIVSMKAIVEEKSVPKGLYTLIPTSTNRNEEYTVLVNSDRPVKFGETWVDPHPYSLTMTGDWNPCEGVLRWANPLLALAVEGGKAAEVVLKLNRISSNPAHKKLGMVMVVAHPGVDYDKPARHPQVLQHETVEKSKYVGADEISMCLELEKSRKPYLVLISLEKNVKGVKYRIMVKATKPITLKNARETRKARVGVKKKLIEM